MLLVCVGGEPCREHQHTHTHTKKQAGGKPAEPGSVLFSFVRQGQVLVTGSPDEDALFEAAMDAGADDLAPVLDDDGAPTGDVRVFTTVSV